VLKPTAFTLSAHEVAEPLIVQATAVLEPF